MADSSLRLPEGIHAGVPEAAYHADCAPEPSLSNSLATILLAQSPMHAKHAHPRLRSPADDEKPRDATAAMDFGSALHKRLLGRGAEIEVIPFPDYKKDVAKDRRDEARQFGRIPILQKDMPRLDAAAEAAMAQMLDHQDCVDFFAPGQSEAVLVWQESDVWCRGMVDRLPDHPHAPAFDIKTTDMSAAPASWDRRMVHAYRTQAPFYGRGLTRLRGYAPPPMRFIVVEAQAPHAISVMCPAPSLYQMGMADVERAIRTWAECMKSSAWPGYPPFTAHIEAPTWLLNAQADQSIRDEFLEAAQ